MAALEEPVVTGFGSGYVRLTGSCGGLRLVRKVLDQTALGLSVEEQVDVVELFQAIFDQGVKPQDEVCFSAGFRAPATLDADEGTSSLDFTLSGGGVSLALSEDFRDLKISDPNAADNARLSESGLSFMEALEAGFIDLTPSPRDPFFTLRIESAERGSFITVAFAWKQAEGFDHTKDFTVYAAAERAAFTLGRSDA